MKADRAWVEIWAKKTAADISGGFFCPDFNPGAVCFHVGATVLLKL